MKTIIVIPARYASTRFPGKPLVPLLGKPSILWTLEAGLAVGADAVVVATDDDRIRMAVEAAGGGVVMTSESARNGTERCAEAAAALEASDQDVIVNLQGDAPLTPTHFIAALIDEMRADRTVDATTPVLRCDGESYARFKADRAAGRVGATTAVFAADRSALYFSKEVVPFLPNPAALATTPVFHHVGVYGYRPPALRAYAAAAPGPLEQAEGLEQLRFLETGRRMSVVEVDAGGAEFWELNNPEDVPVIEAMLKRAEKN
ncbi:MAG: 3-deoxy-manno-octulosonate cytidylyltransferase [Pseudomonadota bacterium]